MKRILVFGITENSGGVESFLLNCYRKINRETIQFDFLGNSYGQMVGEKELRSLGGRTFHIIARSKNPLLYRKQLDRLFREHASEWSAVWVNVCSLANIDYLKAAKKYGIQKRIIHSHNSRNMDGKLRGLLHARNRKTVDRYATDFWACSEEAAKWFYRDDLMPKVKIIHNAIDPEMYAFSPEKRVAVRKSLSIGEGTFVIGNVGRLHFQKNQTFAVKIFREYLKKDPDSLLVLVGGGEDEELLRRQSQDIRDKVVFAGVQTDVQGWLSAFDFFLFPSLFEGLGIAALEAQANGLPVLASKGAVPKEVKVNDNCSFCSLRSSPAVWAEKIRKAARITDYNSIKKTVRSCGYDSSTEACRLQDLLTGETRK